MPVKMARAGRPLRVVDDQFGCPTFTVDLVDATLRLIDKGAQGLFHVTNSGVTTWYKFTEATLREFGVLGDLAPVTTAEWVAMRPKQARRPLYSALDGGAYTRATGQSMRPWQEALHEYRRLCGDDLA